ncbi:MAG: DNA-deoxyinosine glycosylase [Nitrosomonadales bacterium]|nr:DNA-deoxyinosine glycosylase [Nitrosomonadales bacterium]
MESRIRSFSPIASGSAHTLILGSMPGEASLKAGQYYAHPRNAFWKIMAEIIGFEPDASYEDRLEALKSSGVALWDVLHSCQRKGSLDSAIETDSIEVNDFVAFFTAHPDITLICFNGIAAEQSYKKYALDKPLACAIQHIRLPSTSPAHAALSFQQKVEAWKTALTVHASETLVAALTQRKN